MPSLQDFDAGEIINVNNCHVLESDCSSDSDSESLFKVNLIMYV